MERVKGTSEVGEGKTVSEGKVGLEKRERVRGCEV